MLGLNEREDGERGSLLKPHLLSLPFLSVMVCATLLHYDALPPPRLTSKNTIDRYSMRPNFCSFKLFLLGIFHGDKNVQHNLLPLCFLWPSLYSRITSVNICTLTMLIPILLPSKSMFLHSLKSMPRNFINVSL